MRKDRAVQTRTHRTDGEPKEFDQGDVTVGRGSTESGRQ
jgi:hypothetical protein